MVLDHLSDLGVVPTEALLQQRSSKILEPGTGSTGTKARPTLGFLRLRDALSLVAILLRDALGAGLKNLGISTLKTVEKFYYSPGDSRSTTQFAPLPSRTLSR